ncbi:MULTISPECIES: T7SS effector LXG polymorphic toxin [Bacillus cereus group]|uniref:Ribonuclease n=1 Tax=Bacillus paranthracis TaxID=2026186 RepID=A0A9X8SPA4_9BACI|nr:MULTISPECIES: T7SS effector LXG polymorphic toxin [Bacillus cereus group]MDA1989572.1 T7SS effector LXG polymorphic toxin [Bacillus cereus group sp. BcHK104]MDX6044427.1 T7SS effector LXG polymorphic toxin [Bacillus paranthracis]ONG78023.1 cytoplasmic protein [Bacillus cereus]SME44887.1 Ribonuclease [Bacillus paranthracis]
MSLNMYLGEVQSQTQSMNAICNATIQSMEQAIQSIDAFAIDTVLQGQTYSSAKAYLVQTFRPLAQGIICLCEELIRQNEAFPNDFQAKVASTDVIEHEIRQQIQEINQSIASIEAIEVLTPMPGVDAIIAVLIAMRKKLEEKLERLYEFNHSSSNNYSTALQLAASITAGLAEVQSGKGFSPVSGTFSTQRLNMDWVSSIQGIIEETARKNDQSIKDIETNNIIEKKSPVRNAWDDATDSIVGTFETAKKMWEAIQRGSGKAIGDEIESAIALSNMDIGTFINVTYALFHLDETAKNMWHAFSNKIKRDMIEGDAESRTELTTYGLTQIATTILGDRALNKVGHITKGAKASSGVSTFANAVKLAKELKPTLEMLQSFKREASYAFSSIGGTIVTKIPQGELIEAYYKFAKSKDGGKGTGKTGEISKESRKIAQTLEAARAQQRTVIESVESGEVALKTTKRKGNYGEMKMDDFFESQTYTRISDDRVLTLDQKIVKGIDAVYENSSPPPKYVIAEAKYNTSKLGKTNDGKQMSEDWILGSERLDSTLSKEKADEIVEEMLLNPENVQRIVIQVMPDGTIVKKILEV